jgi:flavin-dependent dehydrogenase
VELGKSISLDGEACSYQYLVGADGQSSKIRRWAGLDHGRLISRRFGFRRHYRISPFSNYVEVHWCAVGQVYITPVGRDEICVAVVTRNSLTRMAEIIHAIPYLRERLSAKDAFTGERGALTATHRLRHVVKANVALVGDASGSVDAVTGQGLAIGFRHAHLLSRSLEEGSLDLYAAEHEKSLKMPRRMAHALLLMDARPSLRNLIMRALANSPDVFGGLLQVHMGEETLLHFLLHHSTAMMKRLAPAKSAVSDIEKAST